ncbi:aceric acid hydrolase [Filimonas effusa]|uniref:Glycoside hydrolase family 127 protein n=1 Tax=Filimonas effusa TaxID=2508721 RepID=A0A4Q1DCL8_9BACT|nr:glycoside hydrolase family 127 protein [Filimonas effusa]RXK86708.1 glycoside hydrolase family 127 protein [Filimonas effusa]
MHLREYIGGAGWRLKYVQLFITGTIILSASSFAQKGLTNTSASPYAKLNSVDMGAVQWTKGFWAERFDVCRTAMVPHLWETYHNAELCHSFKNFEIAAKLDTGSFIGPSFHDGDFYKTLEAVAGMYAAVKDPALDKMMDEAIAVIAKAQRPDGYVYTKSIIEQQQTGKRNMFDDKLSFEAYNFGHLMTAACIHYRATGKTSLLRVAEKAADFLIGFYNNATPEQARNAICPSHYMGIIELYRTTSDPKYLALTKKLIDIRGTTEGTDDNSDRVPFRDMKRVVGHAVRANYLFAGVADVYAETGDTSLLHTLDIMWDDVINKKMYITGGCGALYDGVSVDGISYNPDTVQRVHQAYGKNYQLPNLSAHNETCANIGNVLWNRRMLQITGDARYADVVELTLYNSVLSGISMDGDRFFYTNPLAVSDKYPYQLRWAGGREKYIALSNCCPPNVVRTIAEVSNYMYSIADDGVYVDMYGGNTLETKLKDGSSLALEQQTNYPWDGNITITLREAPANTTAIYLRIPGWCINASLSVNGRKETGALSQGTYVKLSRQWKKGDKIQLVLDMPATLIESNPLVEETRNQVAVKRGPIVYCVESVDLQKDVKISDLIVPASIQLQTKAMKIDNGSVIALEGLAKRLQTENWQNTLYKKINTNANPVTVRWIPYYAWANRGKADMSVWLPVSR